MLFMGHQIYFKVLLDLWEENVRNIIFLITGEVDECSLCLSSFHWIFEENAPMNN